MGMLCSDVLCSNMPCCPAQLTPRLLGLQTAKRRLSGTGPHNGLLYAGNIFRAGKAPAAPHSEGIVPARRWRGACTANWSVGWVRWAQGSGHGHDTHAALQLHAGIAREPWAPPGRWQGGCYAYLPAPTGGGACQYAGKARARQQLAMRCRAAPAPAGPAPAELPLISMHKPSLPTACPSLHDWATL